MGSVALIVRVMPESPEIDLEALKAAIRERVTVHDIREEPIGFGLKALKLAVVGEDRAGESDNIEGAIRTIPGVERAEVIEVTLT